VGGLRRNIFTEYCAKGGIIGFALIAQGTHEGGDSRYLAMRVFRRRDGHADAREEEARTRRSGRSKTKSWWLR